MTSLRILSLGLVAILSFALLAACGDDEGDSGGTDATTRAAASPTDGGGGGDGNAVELEIAAENTAYDVDELSAPAGAAVTLVFDNDDEGLMHNWSLYPDEESTDSPIFQGDRIEGVDTINYEFTAPEDPGTYHFHCDVHPTAMTGEFIVE
jgi:plastocyanin